MAGAALPFEMAAGGSMQSVALVDADLTVLAGEVRTRELIRIVFDSGETTEQWQEWTTPYATDWSRLVLEPVDPASPGVCMAGPVFRIENDGRRLRTDGTRFVGDCEDLPIAGPEPFERVYESVD